jgi:hypothetical protein
MRVKVKQGCKGFWKGQRKRAGQFIKLEEGDAFSPRWMEKVEEPKAEKPKASTTKKKPAQSKTASTTKK